VVQPEATIGVPAGSAKAPTAASEPVARGAVAPPRKRLRRWSRLALRWEGALPYRFQCVFQYKPPLRGARDDDPADDAHHRVR
jgi:hypothetical protein